MDAEKSKEYEVLRECQGLKDKKPRRASVEVMRNNLQVRATPLAGPWTISSPRSANKKTGRTVRRTHSQQRATSFEKGKIEKGKTHGVASSRC